MRSLTDPLRKHGLIIVTAILMCTGIAYWWETQGIDVESLFERAQVAAENDDLETAILLLDRVLEHEPRHSRALLYRGQITLQQGNALDAIEYFKLVRDQPQQEAGVARYLEGTAWYTRRHARNAERLFLQSVKLHPTYLQPREGLIRLYNIQYRSTELQEQLSGIRRIRPWNVEELFASQLAGLEASQVAENIPILEEFAAVDREDVKSRIALAQHYVTHGRSDDATLLLERAIERFPENLELKAILAIVRLQKLDHKAAGLLLQEDTSEGELPESWQRAQGLYAFEMKNWAKAISCFTQVIVLNPNDYNSVYKLGISLQRIGQNSQAEERLNQAKLTEKLSVVTSSFLKRDRSRPSQMSQFMLKAGRILLELDRPDEAGDWLSTFLASQPQHKEAQALLQRAVQQIRQSSQQKHEYAGEISTRSNAKPILELSAPLQGKEFASEKTKSTIRFRDDHAAAGIDFQYFNGQSEEKQLLGTVGGGVAVIDYDCDGWPDLYFPNGCRTGDRHTPGEFIDNFYRNISDGAYANVTELARMGDSQFGQGCVAADYNNDGFPDLVVATYGEILVYHNLGDGTFDEVAEQIGISGSRWSSSLAMSDLDLDGDLDLYVANYVMDPFLICRDSEGRPATCSPDNFDAEQDLLFLNLGDGQFSDITESSGIQCPNGKGLGVVIADFDNDRLPDIYVANDGEQNFLFQNQTVTTGIAKTVFTEVGLYSGAGMSSEGRAQAGMGIACGDFNHNGWLDLYVTNFYKDTNTLYRNLGGLIFSDETRKTQLADPTFNTLGFGTQAVDFDRDGNLEIVVANGHIDNRSFEGTPWQMHPQCFRSLSNGTFEEISDQIGPYFRGKYIGRGVARVDFNQDALTDLVVVHQDRPVALLNNQTTRPGRVLVLQLFGVTSNRDAIGTRIRVTANSNVQTIEIIGGDGYCASNERTLQIGVGTAQQIAEVEIQWPSGQKDVLKELRSNVRVLQVESRPPLITAIHETF